METWLTIIISSLVALTAVIIGTLFNFWYKYPKIKGMLEFVYFDDKMNKLVAKLQPRYSTRKYNMDYLEYIGLKKITEFKFDENISKEEIKKLKKDAESGYYVLNYKSTKIHIPVSHYESKQLRIRRRVRNIMGI